MEIGSKVEAGKRSKGRRCFWPYLFPMLLSPNPMFDINDSILVLKVTG